MNFKECEFGGSFLIEPDLFSDERGWFARYYSADEFRRQGIFYEWVQMNHSFTFKRGTIRGMHFQAGDFKEAKLVRCISGKIFDVIVDVRKDSPDFLKWKGFELSAETRHILYIPEGFAHGFQCMEDRCELLYHHSRVYNPESEMGLRYNDPMVSIEWPLPVSVISKRDISHPFISNSFKGV